MEFETTESKVLCCRAAETKTAILPVEVSMILPDYYPDVMKILRYTAKAISLPVGSEENGETVSGSVQIEVNYLSEEGELSFCHQVQPYQHTFPKEGATMAAEALATVTEVGCRAVSKRRIDVHGVLNLELRTLAAEEKSFLSAVEGNGFVSRGDVGDYTLITGEYYKAITFEDDGELGYGKPEIGKILRSSATASITECHVIQDKIVTKGEVNVKILWTPEQEEDKTLYTSDFHFPLSRILDAEGTDPQDICDAFYIADFPELTPSESGTSVHVKGKIGIFARVYRKNEVRFLTDAFSTDFENKVNSGDFSVVGDPVPVETRESIYEQMENTSGEDVVDFWVETEKTPFLNEENKIETLLKLCLFVRDEEGELTYREKELKKTFDVPGVERETAFYNLEATVLSEDLRSTRGGNTELSAEILVDGTIYPARQFRAVTDCAIDTEKTIPKKASGLLLYYGEAGENIWEIAKTHRTSYERILSENDLSDTVLSERKMLVIPRE